MINLLQYTNMANGEWPRDFCSASLAAVQLVRSQSDSRSFYSRGPRVSTTGLPLTRMSAVFRCTYTFRFPGEKVTYNRQVSKEGGWIHSFIHPSIHLSIHSFIHSFISGWMDYITRQAFVRLLRGRQYQKHFEISQSGFQGKYLTWQTSQCLTIL